MPRSARRTSSTNVYHVMVRGVDRMNIFIDDQDRYVFLRYMKELLEELGGELYAWCLMDNHVHLLLSFELDALSEYMHKLNGRYAIYFNSKYQRVGHFFQGRFKSEPVEDDAYFLTVVRYIHQNPVKAFMTMDCNYRWSSFREYAGKPLYCSVGFVLGMFEGLEHFLAFHKDVAFGDKCLEMPLCLSDSEAARYASNIVGEDKLQSLRYLNKDERDRVLRTLKNCMLPVAQIARLTTFGKSTVYRA